MSGHRRSRINRIYKRHPQHPFDAVWKWAQRPKGAHAKLVRFEALDEWAAARSQKKGDKFDNARPAYQRRVKGLRRRIARHGGHGLASVKVTVHPGDPHWGGGNDVVHQFVEPFMTKRGLPIGSGKRTPAENAAVGGSPTSDHLTTHTMTMARDFPTFAGEDDARALAKALGYGGWQPNSYTTFDIHVDGHTFRVQILWGAEIGHSDHVHVGVAWVS